MTLIEMLRANDSWEADAAAKKLQSQANRIEKLEAALRMVIDWDNTHDLEDGPDWDAVMGTACKALEGKDD